MNNKEIVDFCAFKTIKVFFNTHFPSDNNYDDDYLKIQFKNKGINLS